jgi:hypothetical protein
MDTRRAQALVELVLGVFALSLVVSALCVFAVYITSSLKAQNTARGPSPVTPAPIEVDGLAERYFIGSKTLKINERAIMPATTIPK